MNGPSRDRVVRTCHKSVQAIVPITKTVIGTIVMKFSWRRAPEEMMRTYIAPNATHAKIMPDRRSPFAFTGTARAMNLATGTLE